MSSPTAWRIAETGVAGKSWPIVPLREVLVPVERPEVPTPGIMYRQVGVRLWGQGAYEREPLEGSQTKYNTLSRVEADDIIVNKIWARNGSVSVITPELAGCYVSGEFPTFVPVKEKLSPSWFRWLTKTPLFWAQCDEKSRGTSGKNRIRPEQFLNILIPLPPLDEQRRIVARIDALADKIEEARGLRREAMGETQLLIIASLRRAFSSTEEYPSVAFESVCAAIIDNLHSNPIYADDGVPCVRSPDVGWGVLNLDSALRTTEEEYIRRTVRGEPTADDIVLVREGGGTGKAALVKEGQRFSLGQRVMMLRPDKGKVLPKFMLYQILSPTIQEEHILPLTKGSASPHLNIGELRRFPFLLPALDEQCRFVSFLDELQSRADALKHLQAETAAELDALLPAVLDRAFRGEL